MLRNFVKNGVFFLDLKDWLIPDLMKMMTSSKANVISDLWSTIAEMYNIKYTSIAGA